MKQFKCLQIVSCYTLFSDVVVGLLNKAMGHTFKEHMFSII